MFPSPDSRTQYPRNPNAQDDQHRNQSDCFELVLRIVLELGGDICAFDTMGRRPFSFLFTQSHKYSVDSWHVTELATLLLRYGADPCDLNVDGTSSAEYALDFGFVGSFFAALIRCDFDVEQVVQETVRRISIFYSGRGQGKSTTIDNETLAPPSTEGLSRRQVVIQASDED